MRIENFVIHGDMSNMRLKEIVSHQLLTFRKRFQNELPEPRGRGCKYIIANLPKTISVVCIGASNQLL